MGLTLLYNLDSWTFWGISLAVLIYFVERCIKRLRSRYRRQQAERLEFDLGSQLITDGWWAVPAYPDGRQGRKIPAVVPGTILTTLIQNWIHPDPDIGLNQSRIPDIFHAGRNVYTYWFCNSLRVPQGTGLQQGGRVRLILHGINYSGRIFIDGDEVLGGAPIKGMYLRHTVDITQQLKQCETDECSLAVLVSPPDHVGCVDKGGQGGDHMIAKDVTAPYVEGWDWILPVPDRNTGIWDHVELLTTGPVALQHPYVFAERVTPEQPLSKGASIRSEVTLDNSTSKTWSGVITAKIWPVEGPHCRQDTAHRTQAAVPGRSTACGQSYRPAGKHADMEAGYACRTGRAVVQWTECVVVPPGSTVHNLKPCLIEKPALWWPIHLGGQALYHLEVTLHLDGFGLSDRVVQRFGIREIESRIDQDLEGHTFYVNGVKVFIRGGNYIASDWMLRWSTQRYRDEVRMHAEMGLNMIRLWAGAACARAPFYEACDEAGILVWQEFWITGDCNGRGATPDSPVSDHSWPLDHALYVASAADTVRRLRSHACVALWCGGNEQVPAADLDAALCAMLPQRPLGDTAPSDLEGACLADVPCNLDSTRAYVSGSLWSGFGQGHGDFSDGPYGIQEPASFFDPAFYRWPFNPEVGSVGVPEAETMRDIFPDPAQAAPPEYHRLPSGLVEEVPNAAWQAHTYISYGDPPKGVRNQILLYGEPSSLEDFCGLAQIANYVQYRALMEGWASGMWERFTGLLLWKTQNPWAGLRGQMYDWRLAQTGGFYGVRCACQPLHVQLNLHTMQVEVVNTSGEALCDATVNLQTLCAASGSTVSKRVSVGSAQPCSLAHVPDSRVEAGHEGVTFVFLQLLSPEGVLLSRNVYWLPDQQTGDFHCLRPWAAKNQVLLSSNGLSITEQGGLVSVALDLVNQDSSHPAFWIRLSLRDYDKTVKPEADQGNASSKSRRVLPAFYSHNYVTLAPEEQVHVAVEFRRSSLKRAYILLFDGWNSSLCVKL